MEALSLGEFIETRHGIAADQVHSELLNQIFILPNHSTQLEIHGRARHQSFESILDFCRLVLFEAGHSQNVLLVGYQLTNGGVVMSPNHAQTTNKNNTYLKNHLWRSLHAAIGSSVLADLFINYSGFQKIGNSFNHLFGDTLEKYKHKASSTSAHLKQFSLNGVLYRDVSQTSIEKLNPISDSKIGFLQQVFKEDYSKRSNPKKVMKKHYMFGKIVPLIISNHRKCRYLPILRQVVQETNTDLNGTLDNLDLALNKRDIIKFCIVIFEKVIPKETYGSSTNKSIIFRSLSKLVLGDLGFRLTLNECLSGIRIKDIPWLGSNQHKMNKQDHIKRENMLSAFMSWLFSSFFPKLLASFFHITHISSSKEIFFFYHTTWRRITKPFVQSYINTFLEKKEDITSVSQSESLNAIHCRLRVMPKKNNDFRIINVPTKGSISTEVDSYMEKVQKEIRPAKRVLNSLRLSYTSTFPKVTSVNQLPLKIFDFKRELLAKYDGTLPELYFLKFDVEACYDNIPPNQVRDALKELITEDDVYYYCSYNHIDLRSMSNKKARKVFNIDQTFELDPVRRPLLWNDGKIKTETLYGDDIIHLAKTQLENSVTKVGNKDYTRKKGIFQGLHLSSLFCDMVFDKMINEKFLHLKDTESIILRIADDFMIISIDAELISYTQKVISKGFEDYGVRINKLKTFTNFDNSQIVGSKNKEVIFCGLKISTENLSVLKEFDSLYIPYVRSHLLATKKLLGILKLRLSYNNLKTRLNSAEYKKLQMENIAKNVILSYVKATRKLQLSIEGFVKFLLDVLSTVKLFVLSEDLRSHYLIILKEFELQLGKNKSKFKECIAFIKYKVASL